jgi:hypothetical protein
MPDKVFTSAVHTSADVNTYLSHTGDGWNTWSPAFAQGVAVSYTAAFSSYFRAGRRIEWKYRLQFGSAGTGGVSFTATLPFAATNTYGVQGSGYFYDASSGISYPFIVIQTNTTFVAFQATSGSAVSPLIGAYDFTGAIASGDIIEAFGTYEAAS